MIPLSTYDWITFWGAVIRINTGYHNTATINLGDDNDSVSTSLEQLFSKYDGNSYTIDGGDGADGVNFGNLPNTTDFSLIKSKQLPDDTWELTIPSSDGGFNTVILSNIESISYSLYTPSDTPASAGSVEDMIQLSLADFLAMTTQI
jgi:hypothetical protein